MRYFHFGVSLCVALMYTDTETSAFSTYAYLTLPKSRVYTHNISHFGVDASIFSEFCILLQSFLNKSRVVTITFRSFYLF